MSLYSRANSHTVRHQPPAFVTRSWQRVKNDKRSPPRRQRHATPSLVDIKNDHPTPFVVTPCRSVVHEPASVITVTARRRTAEYDASAGKHRCPAANHVVVRYASYRAPNAKAQRSWTLVTSYRTTISTPFNANRIVTRNELWRWLKRQIMEPSVSPLMLMRDTAPLSNGSLGYVKNAPRAIVNPIEKLPKS
jgi:hypothetical protein